MASRYPRATWKPLGTQTEPRMKAHDIVCLHTMVGYLTSTDAYFRSEGYTGVESHYGIGGAWGGDVAKKLDGVVWQWQDRAYQADANGPDGNHRVISVETADNAPARSADIKPWTSNQLDALARLLAWESSVEAHAACPAGWACRLQGIPLALIPDTKPGRRGIGYHAQGVPGNGLVAGGEAWSLSRGKECPAPARIRQIPDVIRRARLYAIAQIPGSVVPNVEDDDVTPQDIAAIVSGVAATVLPEVRAARDTAERALQEVRSLQTYQGELQRQDVAYLTQLERDLEQIARRMPRSGRRYDRPGVADYTALGAAAGTYLELSGIILPPPAGVDTAAVAAAAAAGVRQALPTRGSFVLEATG